MSSSSTAVLNGGLRDVRPVPPGNQLERLASTGAPARSPRRPNSVTGIRSSAPAVEARRTAAALKQRERDELEQIVAGTVDVGELLRELGSADVDGALAVVVAARFQLDRVERQLVRLALQSGRSWARIGAALGIASGRATHDRFASTR
jgi:hypothetical protein